MGSQENSMSFIQIINPNVGIPCIPGWCLQYVQNAYGTPWAGATATDGWNRAQFKHADGNFPNDVAVPVWFAMSGEPAGHVVIRMADGSYYSTSHPTNRTAYHHPNLNHLLSYYGGRLSLRGWSEDLNGTRVIKEGEMPIPNTDNFYWRYRKAMQYIRGRDMSREEFNKNFVGNTDLGMLEAMLDNPEADANFDSANVGRVAKRDNWPGQIHALQDQVNALNKRPTQEQLDTLQKQMTELSNSAKEAVAERDKLKAQAEADTLAGDTFLRRLGQLITKFIKK